MPQHAPRSETGESVGVQSAFSIYLIFSKMFFIHKLFLAYKVLMCLHVIKKISLRHESPTRKKIDCSYFKLFHSVKTSARSS